MITREEIRKKLEENIRQSGLTQKEICERVGIKPPTMSAYFSGKAMPAIETFANICVIIDVDPADILCTNKAQSNKIQSKSVTKDEFLYEDNGERLIHKKK